MSENSGGKGLNSTPEMRPPSFKLMIFDCKLFIATFRCEMSEDPSRYLSVCNKRLAVRYRFLPAILIEFPSDDCRD